MCPSCSKSHLQFLFRNSTAPTNQDFVLYPTYLPLCVTMAAYPLFRRNPRQSAGIALVAIFFAYFGNWIVPQSAFSRVLAEMTVALVSLTALTLFIIAHHRRGKGRIINQTQEEVVLIGIFGLFWFAFLIGLRAWNDRHGTGRDKPLPSETIWDSTEAPFQKESEIVRACIRGRMMCVVEGSNIIPVRSSFR
ncbi:hypothetical protein FRC15_007863 [Serendipita sp. 397]|nr:hypothetical protein FRC15_007863 [Serendipita sp. 397]